MSILTQTAYAACRDEFERLDWCIAHRHETRSRRFVERVWTRAIAGARWALADLLFDHLYPGVFDEQSYGLLTVMDDDGW